MAKKAKVTDEPQIAKLTEEQVLDIRKDPSRKMDIARKYGVSFWTIRDIKNGKSWGHLHAEKG